MQSQPMARFCFTVVSNQRGMVGRIGRTQHSPMCRPTMEVCPLAMYSEGFFRANRRSKLRPGKTSKRENRKRRRIRTYSPTKLYQEAATRKVRHMTLARQR